MLIRKTIGRNIRRHRERIGMSQSAFANMISVGRSYENEIENGKHNVSVNELMKIADGLDVPLSELFFGLTECAPRNLTQQSVDYCFMKLSDEEE